MPVEVKVPSIGESISSGILGAWRKKPGEFVKEGDTLFEIETDKVTSEVFAEIPGTLEQLVPEGEEVQVGQVVARINESAEPPSEKPSEPAAPPFTEKAEAQTEEKAAALAEAAPKPTASPAQASTGPLSPAVKNLVEEKGVDPSKIQGSGKGGRITKADVLAHLESAPPPSQSSASPSSPAPAAAPQPAPASGSGSRTTRKKMSQLRRKIADRLVSAQHTAALLTTFNEVDMSNLMALRSKVQDAFVASHGIKLGFMSFFVKAVVYALKQVPNINAQIDGDEIVLNHFFDIGVAIGTEKGLIVPVIRGADTLSFADIEKSIADYAQRGRSGKITLADLEGGVFTISNGGIYGSMLSTPIVNPPQSAILGMHNIQDRPMAIKGRVEIRPMMYLALTYDHRIVDGKEAVTFLVKVKESIENPGIDMLGL